MLFTPLFGVQTTDYSTGGLCNTARRFRSMRAGCQSWSRFGRAGAQTLLNV